jgi:hypothetical protein
MKCPKCGNKLTIIHRGEYYCDNIKCSQNSDHYTNSDKRIKNGEPADYPSFDTTLWAEFYGNTQEEINNNISPVNGKKSKEK